MSAHDDASLTRAIPLGRYRGVPVVAHWSVLVVAALLSFVLADDVLPAWQPGRSPGAYWSVGVLTAVGFLTTLLAHELAHVAAARHYGMRVRHVSLWLLGGFSELDDEPRTPRADAAVAAAGPLTSLGLGAAFTGLAYLTGHGLPAVALGWLAGVNLLLGTFNLLPGTPLDGGRLLRAAVWARTRDRRRAVDAAARVGRGLGYALLALGFVETFAGAPASGIWLVVVGWFITSRAAAERYADLAHDVHGLRVRDVMTVPPATVPSWWTVTNFLDYVGRAHPADGAFVLVDFDGRPSGVLTIPALTRLAPADRDTTRLRDCRSAGLPLAVAADTPLEQLLVPLRLRGGIAVVTEDGRVVATLALHGVQTAADRQRAGVAGAGQGR